MKKGKFITFEGIDGSGKTSLIKSIAYDLEKRKLDILTTQEPGGTQFGKRLREIFLSNHLVNPTCKESVSPIKEKISPLTEALLFAADRAQHVECLIKPALKAGKIVISDRFADSSLAYQGAGRRLSLKVVKQLVRIATQDLTPDLTILLDLPVKKALSRKHNQTSETNRMDTENEEFYERVRKAYLNLALENPKRFRIVSADRPYQDVKDEVLSLILDFLKL